MNKTWLKISLIYLLIVAVLGTLLRFLSYKSLGISYSNILHAHSHIAFLGWVYNILFAILTHVFLNPQYRNEKTYQAIFWLTQIANIGMLISFSVQGYGLYSISFSTMHILLSFYFAFQFLKDAGKNTANISKHFLSFGFARTAVIFMIISAAGPLCLGPIIALKGAASDLYFNAIYFYLHFQYNGWFCFAVLALFFRFLEWNDISFSFKKANIFYYCMVVSCIPSYFLSVLWVKPAASIYFAAGLSAFIQVIGLIYLLSIISEIKTVLRNYCSKLIYSLMFISATCFGAKILLQQTAAFPLIAEKVYQTRNFIVGYMHLVFIGFVTFYILSFLLQENEIRLGKAIRVAVWLTIAGFIASEVVVFAQGLFGYTRAAFVPVYLQLLFISSLFIAVGIALILYSHLRLKPALN